MVRIISPAVPVSPPSSSNRAIRMHSSKRFVEGGGELCLMLLLLTQDLPNVLRDGVLPQAFALCDALTVVANCIVLIVEISSQQFFRFVRHFDSQDIRVTDIGVVLDTC